MKALVVDDVEINLIIAQELLLQYGLQTDIADSGAMAVKRARLTDYDLIFMDYLMPEMNGVETTRKLREHGYKGRIIALTGNDFDSPEIAELFDASLLKPIDSGKLENVLTNLGVNTTIAMHAPPQTDRLMRAFVRDARNAVSVLRETDECVAVTTVFHGMKSALANIERYKESIKARELEKAVKNADMEYVRANTPEFIAILEGLLAENSVTSRDSCASSCECDDGAAEKVDFSDIIAACNDYNIVAAESALETALAAAKAKSVRDFLTQMLDVLYSDSDFDKVAEEITAFMQ
jgi:CheY-like chemotaxis protein